MHFVVANVAANVFVFVPYPIFNTFMAIFDDIVATKAAMTSTTSTLMMKFMMMILMMMIMMMMMMIMIVSMKMIIFTVGRLFCDDDVKSEILSLKQRKKTFNHKLEVSVTISVTSKRKQICINDVTCAIVSKRKKNRII